MTKPMTQKELRKHLAMVLSRRDYDREGFKQAVEEYVYDHEHLRRACDRCVRWTTPGVWVRFIDNCWAEYREFRQIRHKNEAIR